MRDSLGAIDLVKIKTIEDSISTLAVLDKSLIKLNLDQFLLFNKAYLIITSAISSARKNGYFKNPGFIENFTISFAKFYFTAINQTLSQDPKLAKSWQIINLTTDSTPEFIKLLIGANAHINRDLPLVLFKMHRQVKNDSLFNDIKKIDKLLIKSSKQILNSYTEKKPSAEFIKRYLIFIYILPVITMILLWRIRTWRDYKKLVKNGLNYKYEKRANKIGQRIFTLGRII